MKKLMGLVIRDRSNAIGFKERQHAASALPHPLQHSPRLLKMKRHIGTKAVAHLNTLASKFQRGVSDEPIKPVE